MLRSYHIDYKATHDRNLKSRSAWFVNVKFQLGFTSDQLRAMAFQATVIAPISLKPGTTIDEGEGAQMLAYGLKTISEQPGFQDCFYGLQLEHPDMLDLLTGRIYHNSLLLTHS